MTQHTFGAPPGEPAKCSFCGKPQEQVSKIIAGPGSVFICDECIELCNDILEEELPRKDAARLAMAELLDEIGATARGEMPLPDRKQLGEWLVLLNRVTGSDAPND